MIFEFIENYKGVNINKDNTIKKFRVMGIFGECGTIEYKHFSGSSLEIIKKKIDRHLNKFKINEQ